MSLATRCIACGTVFRVVRDQLKVSEGWVRCGRCDEVFNAVENLFDLERDAPPDWSPPPSPPEPAEAIVTAHFQKPSLPPEDDGDVFHLSDDDRIHSRFFQPGQEDVTHTPADATHERDRLEFAEARFNEELIATMEAEAPPPVRLSPKKQKNKARWRWKDLQREWRRAWSKLRKPKPPADDPQSPGFLQAAHDKARWESPRVRLGLSALALLLACLLVGQAAMHFRDHVAARWAATRPVLAKACSLMNCHLVYPRRIDDITVESSSLSPANGGAAYKLSVVLRNRNGRLTVATPSIDLSLTDTAGQLVARRALSFADFRLGAQALPPSTETTFQLLMSTDGRRVSGYTVEIFYP